MKILFLDIDGTILSHTTNSIPSTALKAINEVRSQGILVFVCTGRHTEEIKKLPLDDLVVDGWITMNGCLNFVGNTIISGYPIEKEDIQILYDSVKENPFPLQLLEKDEMYMNMHSKVVEEGLKTVHSEQDPIQPLERMLENDIYMFIPWCDIEQFEKIHQKMKHVELVKWSEFVGDCFLEGTGKSKGIQDVLNYYHLEKNDAVSIGDGDNDVSMFEACGYNIAMKNACNALKEKADYVCKHIDEDGLEDAIQHLMNLE